MKLSDVGSDMPAFALYGKRLKELLLLLLETQQCFLANRAFFFYTLDMHLYSSPVSSAASSLTLLS